MNRRFAPLAILALLLAALPASGQVYSWKDKDGRTHYGDMPPAAVEATLLRGAPPARPNGEASSAADPQPSVSPSSPRSLTEREQAYQERRAAERPAE